MTCLVLVGALSVGLTAAQSAVQSTVWSGDFAWDNSSQSTSWLQPTQEMDVNFNIPHVQLVFPPHVGEANAAAIERLRGVTCDIELDVMVVQDITGSYKDDLPFIRAQLPEIFEAIIDVAPATLFGVSVFKDKPYRPLGENDDHCYDLLSPLQNSPQGVVEAYAKMRADGGGDMPESQYTAMIATALDERVRWRTAAASNSPPRPGSAAFRLMLLHTDAQPHLPDDYLKFDREEWPEVPAFLPPHRGVFSQDDPEEDCLLYDYPSPWQVRDVLEANNITLGILTPDRDPLVVGAWKWVNEDLLGQSSSYYRHVDDTSANLAQAAVEILMQMFSDACHWSTEAPSTVEPPSTPEPTTAEPATDTPTTETVTTLELTTLEPTTVTSTTTEPTTIVFTTLEATTVTPTTVTPTTVTPTTVTPTTVTPTTMTPTTMTPTTMTPTTMTPTTMTPTTMTPTTMTPTTMTPTTMTPTTMTPTTVTPSTVTPTTMTTTTREAIRTLTRSIAAGSTNASLLASTTSIDVSPAPHSSTAYPTRYTTDTLNPSTFTTGISTMAPVASFTSGAGSSTAGISGSEVTVLTEIPPQANSTPDLPTSAQVASDHSTTLTSTVKATTVSTVDAPSTAPVGSSSDEEECQGGDKQLVCCCHEVDDDTPNEATISIVS